MLTGQPVLFDAMSRLVVRAQINSLALALVLVAFLLLIVYRRVWQTCIALIPMRCRFVSGSVFIPGRWLQGCSAGTASSMMCGGKRSTSPAG